MDARFAPGYEPPASDAVVFRTSAMGDVALMTGVLEHWRATRGMRFTVVTRQEFAGLFASHPAVVEFVGLERKDLGRWWRTIGRLAGLYGDRMLIDLHGTNRSMLLASVWKGPLKRYPKESLARRLYRMLGLGWAERRLLQHTVPQRYAMALDAVPPPAAAVRPRVFLEPELRERARDYLISKELDPQRPIIALHPYATHASKTWPPDRWRELADLLDERGIQWLVVGMSYLPVLRDLAAERDLTNQSDLLGTCAILANCAALVTGDSGPMHLAGAVDTPVIALFGPTTRHWGFYPQGPRDVVLERDMPCRPCSLHGDSDCRRRPHCLLDIPAAEVLAAVERRAAGGKGQAEQG